MAESSRETISASDEEILTQAVSFIRKKYEALGIDFDASNEKTWAEILDLAHKYGDSQTAKNRMNDLVSKGFQLTASRVARVNPKKNTIPRLAQIGGLLEKTKKH